MSMTELFQLSITVALFIGFQDIGSCPASQVSTKDCSEKINMNYFRKQPTMKSINFNPI